MANMRDCHAYKPWRQHASPYSDAYPLGYKGAQPYTPAVLEVNKYNDERQAQLRNIQNVNEVIFSARVGKATPEMLRAAGNPFQHDFAGKLIPGREPYLDDFIPKACNTTAELEKLFKKGFPSLAQ